MSAEDMVRLCQGPQSIRPSKNGKAVSQGEAQRGMAKLSSGLSAHTDNVYRNVYYSSASATIYGLKRLPLLRFI